MIQPAGVDVIVSEAFRLQQLDEILDCGPEVAPDGKLLHGHHHVPESPSEHSWVSKHSQYLTESLEEHKELK